MCELPVNRKQIQLCLIDILLLILAFYLALIIKRNAYETAILIDVFDKYAITSFFSILGYVISFYVFNLYGTSARKKKRNDIFQLIFATMLGTFLMTILFFFFQSIQLGWEVILMNASFVFLLTLVWRKIFSALSRTIVWKERALVIGAGWAADLLLEELNDKMPYHRYRILGLIDDDTNKQGRNIQGYKVVGTLDDLEHLVEEYSFSTLIITNHECHKDLLRATNVQEKHGLKIVDVFSIYKGLTGKIPADYSKNQWLINEQNFNVVSKPYVRRLRRLTDIVLASMALILTSWLFIPIALLIKVTSKGSVFYKQQRVGQHRQEFNMIKFRTMIYDAETATGPIWSQQHDSRVTFVGWLLRRIHLDELPQFINILRGEMSLIGPRPERPELVIKLEKLIPYYYLRYIVKPGLTGWAQVNCGYGASKENAIEKLQYDLYYIQESSFLLDVAIILKTVCTMILRRDY